jgi:hypothetical protein
MKMIIIPVNTNQPGFLPSLPPDQVESAFSDQSDFHLSGPTETHHTHIYKTQQFFLLHKTEYSKLLQQLTGVSACFLAMAAFSFLLGVLPLAVGKSVPVSFLYCVFNSNSVFTSASTTFW